MRVKLILFVIGLLLLTNCTYEQPVNEQGKTVTYIVEEPQAKTFVVEEESSLSWVKEARERRNELNVVRYIDEDKDKQEEFEIKSRLSNVRRIIENDFGEKELIVGFDEELDNPRFKEVD